MGPWYPRGAWQPPCPTRSRPGREARQGRRENIIGGSLSPMVDWSLIHNFVYVIVVTVVTVVILVKVVTVVTVVTKKLFCSPKTFVNQKKFDQHTVFTKKLFFKKKMFFTKKNLPKKISTQKPQKNNNSIYDQTQIFITFKNSNCDQNLKKKSQKSYKT